jgi:hypothetical protein
LEDWDANIDHEYYGWDISVTFGEFAETNKNGQIEFDVSLTMRVHEKEHPNYCLRKRRV